VPLHREARFIIICTKLAIQNYGFPDYLSLKKEERFAHFIISAKIISISNLICLLVQELGNDNNKIKHMPIF
jgi:hypothetical protein